MKRPKRMGLRMQLEIRYLRKLHKSAPQKHIERWNYDALQRASQ